MTHEPPTKPQSDFMAAEAIKGILSDREQSEQQRILRWVCESLDLPFKLAQPHASVTHSQQQDHPDQPSNPDTSSQQVDIRTFVQQKQPDSDVQFVAATAYYHRFLAPPADRKDAINTEDLQTAARLAQRPVFKTPSVPMNNSVQQGYMDRAGRGAYRLNAVGENLVAMTLPRQTESKAKSKRRAPKKRKVTRKRRATKGKRAK